MAAGDGITPGTNVEQRVYAQNNIYKDEWLIFSTNINKEINVPYIQQNDGWCWATSAQMLARTDFPTTTNETVLLAERKTAVYHIFGNNDYTVSTYPWKTDPDELLTQGGLPNHAATAAAYYAGMVDGNATYSAVYAPYSEETLIRFLNDGQPVIQMHIIVPQIEFDFDIEEFKANAIKEVRALYSQITNEQFRVAGHAITIVGMQWDNVRNCMIYRIYNPNTPSSANTSPIYLTYKELIINTQDDSYNIWTSSVVKKSEYAHRVIFENQEFFEYNSLDVIGGTQ